ncbi:MAG TPA: hypothetical protein VFD58_17205 [Blastocatellia bacterium]|nr:hypothetical protein [Blastocatellia bacterium]
MGAVSVKITEAVLTKRLLEQQPHSREMLEALRRYLAGRGGHGVFAPIKGQRCGACNMSIASARLQRARLGLFLACANCSRFLYVPEVVMAGDKTGQPE